MTTNYPIALGNYPIYRGDASGRNKVTITVTDNDDNPVDLTVFGATWKCQARNRTELVTLTVNTSQAATGIVEVSFAAADTTDLADVAPFDVQVTGGSISPITLFAGTFLVEGEVTTP